ncbi:MAG: phosphatidylethanolamine N-methyltransferase [bacterium]|nr:MAG: phosphatidylethanolamine N-methyltransferase [bacterium]
MFKINSNYIGKVYSLYSPVYDLIFGKVMEQGRKKAISLLNIDGDSKILEIGVGTGLTLGLYPPDCSIIGIDISEKMIAKAMKRAFKVRNNNHITFKVMDALNLDFEDNTFDAVVASYVVTTVSDPLRVCNEMKRVCKAGGQIIVVNHSRSGNGFLGKLEDIISPLCWKVGFATDLNVLEPLESSGINVDQVIPVKPFKLYKVIQGTKAGS